VLTDKNLALWQLPGEELEQLRPLLSETRFNARQVLQDPGDAVETLYFPTDSALSLLVLLSEGRSYEVATVGREGFVGASALLGHVSPYEVVVQVPGNAITVSFRALQPLLQSLPAFSQRLLKCTGFLMSQVSRSAGCNAGHAADSRLARWLLVLRDRATTDTLPLTHEFIARMLGVSRSTVSIETRRLQEAGFVRARQGSITVIDAEGLKQAACDCYAESDSQPVTFNSVPPIASTPPLQTC
jgi:CRP-like cAMP-binding protein